jgi:hypothetical protein
MEFTAFQSNGELSTVLCTRMLLSSRKVSNPKELYKIMKKLFRAVGSQKGRANGRCSKLILNILSYKMAMILTTEPILEKNNTRLC